MWDEAIHKSTRWIHSDDLASPRLPWAPLVMSRPVLSTDMRQALVGVEIVHSQAEYLWLRRDAQTLPWTTAAARLIYIR